MKFLSTAFLSLLAASSVVAQTPPKPAAPTKQAPAKVAPAKPAATATPAAPKMETKAAAKPATRRADGTTATVEQVKEAQKALADKGLYKGKVSGRLNKDFQAALKTYQQQNNLKPTGRLNQETIAKLHQG